MEKFEMAEEVRIGFIALHVRNLDPMIRFYKKILGLSLLKHQGGIAYLGVLTNQQVLLTISQPKKLNQTISPINIGFVLPNRQSFDLLYQHLVSLKVAIEGYYAGENKLFFTVKDPVGNTVILAYDENSNQWQNQPIYDRHDTTVKEETAKLSAHSVTGHFTGIPAGVAISYLELPMVDLSVALDFYTNLLGFDIINSDESGLTLIAPGSHHSLVLKLLATDAEKITPMVLDYLNIVVPEVADLIAIEANLSSHKYKDYNVHKVPHLLQITDPAGYRLWLTRA